MLSFCFKSSPGARTVSRVARIAALLLCFLFSMNVLLAQSTTGSFLGTVRDASGSVIADAKVILTNQDTSSVTTTTSNKSGQYEFLNAAPGNYSIDVESSGFTRLSITKLTLLSRDTQRVDGVLAVGAANVSVTVQAAAAVINTDTSNIAQTRTGIELTTLPIAVASIQSGSTSPYATLQSQAGVQVDSSGNLNVAGSTAAMMNVSVDGISTMNVTASNVATEMFPSFNSIEEIRVSQNANAAEFGGTTDITTVSKSGTNNGHGSLFYNYQSKGFNSNDPTALRKPNLVLNDFGGVYSGPVNIPFLYKGKDKTFYFLSYEGLRRPFSQPVVLNVPSLAERAGDFSAFPKQLFHPDGVTPWVGNQIPVSQWNSTSAYLLNRYYPLPNTGAAGAITNNYGANVSTPVSSDQGDARIDQTITSKQSVYVRYSYKQRATQSLLNSGLGGTIGAPQKNTSVTGAYNYVLTPTLLNEFRSGLSKYITATSFDSNSSVIAAAGIQGIPDLLPTSVAAEPGVTISGLTSVSGGSSANSSHTYQFSDALTWVHGKHTVKGGADYRRLYAFASNVFSTTRLGRYSFTGSTPVGAAIIGGNIAGSQLAAFVQGVPDTTVVTDVSQPNQNGRGNAYAFFLQDDFKVTNSLTLSYGLRYEYHPPFTDKYSNTANFLTDYISTQNGQTVRGAVVIPDQYALANNVLPSFRTSVSPYPILTAAQAGEPYQLTRPTKTDFAPRFGFAWRLFHNDKTVIRGGLGHFIVPVLGQEINAGWAVSASAVANYTNAYQAGTRTPVISFPTPFATTPNAQAALYFDLGQTTHYKDPTMEQWNLTLEQAIGFRTGFRISYMGNHAQKLNGTPNINQVPYHAVASGTAVTQSQQPYPYLGEITAIENVVQTNYNGLTLEVNRRMNSGLQFQSSYTFARNLSNNTITNYYNLLQDYGNVPNSTRRHRFLASALYNLPFGRNQMFLGRSNFVVDKLISNWSTSLFYIGQSGAFLTPAQSSNQGDPTGTGNFLGFGAGSAIRPDVVAGAAAVTTPLGARNRLVSLVNSYTSVMASATAAAPGRQGTAAVGSIVGNGTESLSMSLMKGISFTERSRMDFGVQVQNLFNHHNYLDPPVTIGTTAFGISTAMQTSGDAGLRSMMLTGRLTF